MSTVYLGVDPEPLPDSLVDKTWRYGKTSRVTRISRSAIEDVCSLKREWFGLAMGKERLVTKS